MAFKMLFLLFIYICQSKLESREYELKNPDIYDIPGDFILDINAESEMVKIGLIGDEGSWMLLGFGSRKAHNIVGYLYHYDRESNEMVLSRILLKENESPRYLGNVKSWSASVTNGIAIISFIRPFKVHGSDFDFNQNMKELHFIYAIGNGPMFSLENTRIGDYTIQLQQKTTTTTTTPKPIIDIDDRFGRFGRNIIPFQNDVLHDDDDDDTRFGMHRQNVFENRESSRIFPNNNNRFNNNNQDRFPQINHDDRFGNSRPNRAFYDVDEREQDNFFPNGYNKLHEKREITTNEFKDFSQGRGPNFDNDDDDDDDDRENFFRGFRNNMNEDKDHFDNEFFQQKPQRNYYG